jgi:hypothetical protein
MTDDLISRKALKEAIRKRLGISSLKYLTEQEKIIVDEIDNAPPIETTIENLISTLSVEELKATTWFKVDTPSGEAISFRREKTGEWIGGEIGHCSICGSEGCASDIWNGCNDGMYCPNCGADMRGE